MQAMSMSHLIARPSMQRRHRCRPARAADRVPECAMRSSRSAEAPSGPYRRVRLRELSPRVQRVRRRLAGIVDPADDTLLLIRNRRLTLAARRAPTPPVAIFPASSMTGRQSVLDALLDDLCRAYSDISLNRACSLTCALQLAVACLGRRRHRRGRGGRRPRVLRQSQEPPRLRRPTVRRRIETW